MIELIMSDLFVGLTYGLLIGFVSGILVGYYSKTEDQS